MHNPPNLRDHILDELRDLRDGRLNVSDQWRDWRIKRLEGVLKSCARRHQEFLLEEASWHCVDSPNRIIALAGPRVELTYCRFEEGSQASVEVGQWNTPEGTRLRQAMLDAFNDQGERVYGCKLTDPFRLPAEKLPNQR